MRYQVLRDGHEFYCAECGTPLESQFHMPTTHPQGARINKPCGCMCLGPFNMYVIA